MMVWRELWERTICCCVVVLSVIQTGLKAWLFMQVCENKLSCWHKLCMQLTKIIVHMPSCIRLYKIF